MVTRGQRRVRRRFGLGKGSAKRPVYEFGHERANDSADAKELVPELPELWTVLAALPREELLG